MTNLSNTQSQVLPHTHTESEITGLSTDLAGKQDKLVAGSNIQIAADGKTVSATDTTYTAGTNISINASNEISAVDTKYDPATQSTAGLMSAADKLKLDGIEPGAGVAKVSGVKGDAESSYREGLVNITKANIGLGNVDNTSDANKPISTATQAALDLKQNIADMPTDLGDFTNNAGFIKNTVNDLANYYKKTETYTQTEIDTLIQNFGGFEVVATLPTSDIKSNVIYLLGPIGTGPDRYEEWIYYSSTWTKIGETSVDLTNYVTTNTAQTISGAKTFSTEPVLPSKTAAPTNSATAPATERQVYDVSAAAVKTTGDQTIAGVKTFQSSPVVPAPTNNTDAATKKYVDDGLATKQATLTTQTAYTAKGSATKVPQITTNTLGQVTGITEVDIEAGGSYNAGEGISIGDVNDYSAMQGPAPDGFHVPSKTEWQGLKIIMDGLSLTTSNNWKINLHMPFAGARSSASAALNSQGSYGFYGSSSPYEADYPSHASLLRLEPNAVDINNGIPRAYGLSIRAFKNLFEVPTSSWTVINGTLGSAGIFWNQTDGLISITSDGTTGYTIMDKNLGATTVYNDGDTLSQANMGNMYQWGNNYGFPSTGTISNTSSTQVNASNYGPGNYYESNTFIIGNTDWSSVQNDDLWGNTTGIITIPNVISNTGLLLHPDSPLKPKYNWYGTQAQYEALTQYYYKEPNDTVYHTIEGALETSGTRSLSKGGSSSKSEPVESVKVKTDQEQADEVMDAALDAVDDKEAMPDVKIENDASEESIGRMDDILDAALDFNSVEK